MLNYNYYNEGVGFDSIRKQSEAQGLKAEVNIVYGQGAVVNGGVSPQPQPQGRSATDWYVYKDGEYSFMTPTEFATTVQAGNVVSVGTVTEGKYTPVGIVPFATNAVSDNKTRIMALNDASEASVAWGDVKHLGEDNPTGKQYNYAFSADFDGQGNTQLIKTAGGESFEAFYPAAYAAENYKAFSNDTTSWYLPAAAECELFLANLVSVKTEIDKYTTSLGVAFPTEGTYFWSSSEWSGEGAFGAWGWDFSTGNASVDTLNKSNTCQVRSFASSPIINS